MQLISIVLRSDTRIRLEFSTTLDATAFTGTGDITIENLDGLGISPGVSQRLPVVSAGNLMELVLSEELVQGGQYELTIEDLPGSDATVADAVERFRPGTKIEPLNAEITVPEVEKALYGVDLVWTGIDYLLTPDGDLATVYGRANVHAALRRRLVSEGLTWDDNYGVKPRTFVDGPSASTPVMRGAILRQMLADDRVGAATVRLELPEEDVNAANYFVYANLIGSSDSNNVSIQVPSTGSSDS